ncbi:MAG: aldehyde dehydrogenase family protein [Sneathiella sp.]
MLKRRKFYIGGNWVLPASSQDFKVINPATEKPVAVISLGSADDVDKAVEAAKKATIPFGAWSVSDRALLMERIHTVYERRFEEMAQAIMLEMGAPISFAREEQAQSGLGHIQATLEALRSYRFDTPSPRGGSLITEQAVGVCALITPWNWPINQITSKVMPALAAGCTSILKPSEMTPLSALLFAEILDEAGVPAGVFNLVNGTGPDVGTHLAAHPDVNLISFTGSTRAGISVSRVAADTVKHVTLELGGKSPNIIFTDADLQKAVPWSVQQCFGNTGQSCDAPTRLLVQREIYDKAIELAIMSAKTAAAGDPSTEGGHLGPVSNKTQFDRVQAAITAGINEGARLIIGGTGRPHGFEQGYFVKPTIFAQVSNDMKIAQEEIFGPVLVIIPFDTENEAIEIANDTPYGLAAYLHTSDKERAKRVSAQLQAGHVSVNGHLQDFDVPFGGFKQSGNGREYGVFGLRDFLEIKAITGIQ